ncbi:26S proteasome regulatory subunit N6 [Puccinia sorghi]|uniref:26S proteasome regulatory subunit N6 n=1 Tax=Puccinia sorghi TaxID=27349 RepID=A0A0L6UMJ8_9BASI|nr:26S proteasome regulatory subunit N6 [Puccinia sorghi]
MSRPRASSWVSSPKLPVNSKDDAILREKELALIRLGQFYRDSKNPEGLASAIRCCRSFMSAIAKAKTAKLVKTLIDFYSQAPLNQHPNSSQTQIVITRENVEWARTEKRVFLRQNLEIKLCSLLFEYQQTKEALALIANLLKELKKLDDKMILTEVHLLESRIRHALSDPPKAKVVSAPPPFSWLALISARTAANSIYCPPSLQAQLDMQSGVLHAEEKDYKTAYSYFFEALEGLSTQDDPRASLALKCMLMCKVMLNLPEDVSSIQGSKLARKYAGRGTEAMQAIAKAHENRSLADFEEALKVYKAELSDDPIVRNHLAALYDTLLEQNLIRIIEPYSRIELSYVAEQVKLPLRDVEAKLSQMILDKVFAGILDQGEGCLEVFEEVKNEKMYDYSLETFKQIGSVVESLYAKAQKLGR